MKIAVSIPDAVGRAADRAARRLGVPRSQLYARAVEEYVRQVEAVDITARLDAVYADETLQDDGFAQAAGRETLRRTPW